MKNHVGSPVEGEDFFDRKNELAATWLALEGNNLLLLAPRRVGKTSLMKRLVSDASEYGYRAIYVTVEGAVDEADFVQRLYRAIGEHHPKVIQQWHMKTTDSGVGALFKRVKKISGFGVSVELVDAAKENWLDAMFSLGQLISELNEPWLLAVDELPLFVLKLLKANDNGERASVFLHNLRELRQNNTSMRWLLAGSIGLDTVTARYHLADTINDLKVTDLGPFSPAVADSFLKDLARSYKLHIPGPTRRHLLQRLHWLLPYYLQLIFSELVEHSFDTDGPVNSEHIDEIFENLLKPAKKNYFDYWRQRLNEELGQPDDLYAMVLLNAACQTPAGINKQVMRGALSKHIHDPDQRDERVRYLLDILGNDGYLVQSEDRYHFRFPLLREFWQRRVAA